MTWTEIVTKQLILENTEFEAGILIMGFSVVMLAEVETEQVMV